MQDGFSQRWTSLVSPRSSSQAADSGTSDAEIDALVRKLEDPDQRAALIEQLKLLKSAQGEAKPAEDGQPLIADGEWRDFQIVFTGAGSSGLRAASLLRAAPSANGPVCRSADSRAGAGFKSIFEMS